MWSSDNEVGPNPMTITPYKKREIWTQTETPGEFLVMMDTETGVLQLQADK